MNILPRILVVLSITCAAGSAFAGNCSFGKRAPFSVEHNGHCKFDFNSLSYAGTPAQQAACLLTPVERAGRIGKPRAAMPDFFREIVGTARDLPDRDLLAVELRKAKMDELAASLSKPVSRGRDNDPAARAATYFVIHDTSTPNYGDLPWPVNIDTDPKINNLKRYACDNDIERAHVFINRGGEVFLAHDFGVPWRATKFETAQNFDGKLKGLFLHIELIQPRRRAADFRGRNDFEAPEPGFSPAQYEALALVYLAASVRAGFWMIPGFHAVIDAGIRNGHDDPQNFRLEDFASALNRLRDGLKQQR
jgi:hypothetical protein